MKKEYDDLDLDDFNDTSTVRMKRFPVVKLDELHQEGQLDTTTTVAMRKFYNKIENEKPATVEHLSHEETNQYLDMAWYSPEDAIMNKRRSRK